MKPVSTTLFAILAAASTTAMAQPDLITKALASQDRPEADSLRDVNRKPEQLIAFAGITRGDKVADIMPGGGYFTRILSNVVGPQGKVYALIPSELLHVAPRMGDAVQTLAASPAFKNVVELVAPAAQTAAPQQIDVAWTSDNYHDVYGFFGAEQAAALDVAVYKMLKPGGTFMVIDHVAAPGTADTAPKALHRIDPMVVKAQVIAAGFVFEGESAALRNPADTHASKVFDPAIRGHTDQFVFKFRKPLR